MDSGLRLRQLFAALQRPGHRLLLGDRDLELQEGVGQHLDRRLQRPAEDLIEGAGGGVLRLPGLVPPLLYLAAVGPGAEHLVGRAVAGVDEALGNPFALGHQRERGLPGSACAARGPDLEEGGLGLRGEAPGGSTVLESLPIARVPRLRVAGEERGVEQRLRHAHPRLVSHRQGDVEVGGEPVASVELIERSVGRVHEVAEVERAALLAVPRVERQGGEEAAARLADAGLGPFHPQAFLGDAEVVPERLGDDGGEGVRGGRLRMDRRRGGDQQNRGSGSERGGVT
jgi:hypothetical protein